jgi:hypothetical protein
MIGLAVGRPIFVFHGGEIAKIGLLGERRWSFGLTEG